MSILSKSLKTETDVIIPKTRSEWIVRSNNTTYESSLSDISNLIHSGIIYQGTHSKSEIIHTIGGIPDINFDLLSIKFKATSDYTEGDTFSINGLSYSVSIGSILFKTDSIVECDIDKVNHIVYIKNKESSYNPTDIPQFTYSGNYEVVDDGELGWRIKFTSSGIFTLNYPNSVEIDCFVVGGGGSGGDGRVYGHGGGGGAGGYTTTQKSIVLSSNISYEIIVGAGGDLISQPKYGTDGQNGGNSQGFNASASGGEGGEGGNLKASGGYGGSGGSGGGRGASGNHTSAGKGGSDGNNGGQSEYSNQIGQGTTTKDFGETNGELYSAGGGGGGNNYFSGAGGGSEGGGRGGDATVKGNNATFYGSGGGGGGRESNDNYPPRGGLGFQGIVIIRNSR